MTDQNRPVNMAAPSVVPVPPPPPPPGWTMRRETAAGPAATPQPLPSATTTAPQDNTSNSNQVNPNNSQIAILPMDEDSKQVNLGHIYNQCREAKISSQTAQVTLISQSTGGTTYHTQSVLCDRFGSLEDVERVTETFHGARKASAKNEKNDCFSATFDPANQMCLMCPQEHPILNPEVPTAIVVSDQCFPTCLSGGGKNCVSIIRLENASLLELSDILQEVFAGAPLPPGTVIVMGSGSHLYRVGASAYASDWLRVMNSLAAKWKGITVCPLPPIIVSDCPGNFARDIGQLAVWLANQYKSRSDGMLEAWSMLVGLTDSSVSPTSALDSLETVKLPMPNGLVGSDTVTYVYQYDHSCPARLKKPDCKATLELVSVLLSTLGKIHSIPIDPEAILARDNSKGVDTVSVSSIVTFGASNLGQLTPLLSGCGLSVVDKTVPGWRATPENLQKIEQDLAELSKSKSTIIVLELFGNAAYRFSQFDGSTSLPIKIGSSYHLPGEVGVTDVKTFEQLAKKTIPLLLSIPENPKIVIPPLPRYLGVGCCGDLNHCTNLRMADFAEKNLEGLTKLRHLIKTTFVAAGVKNFRVVDSLGGLAGHFPKEGSNRPGNKDLIPAIKAVLARDGVHLTETGKKNLASTIYVTICDIKSGSFSPQNVVSGPVHRSHYWRGFISPVGSQRREKNPGYAGGHVRRGHRAHPYRKK